MDRTYTVVLLREGDGGYSVSVPALKGCHTQGDDLPEALAMAHEAVELHLESMQAHGDPLPPDVGAFELALRNAREAVVYKIAVTLPAALPEREAAAIA